MSQFNYLWYQYRLQVACDKCGNVIVCQQLDGSPECGDCGETSPHSWEDAMRFCQIEDLRHGDTGSKQLIGLMTAKSCTEEVAGVNCYHCQKSIHPNVDVVSGQDYACESCRQKIAFKPIQSAECMVFYRFINTGDTLSESLIAVRCISCGAPLDVDPGNVNFECSFCRVQNILPVSLRQERVLDDIYIGVQKKTLSISELLDTSDPMMLIDGLNSHHGSEFAPARLDAAMLKFIDNEAIFNLMLYKAGHIFSEDVLEKIWQESKSSQMIKVAGNKLGKSKHDIANQQSRFTKKAEQENKSSRFAFTQRIKSWFGL